MDYTTEELIRIHHMYMPTQIRHQRSDHYAKTYATHNVVRRPEMDLTYYQTRRDTERQIVPDTVHVSKCMLMLRNPNSLTEHEFKEFGKFMFGKDLIGCHAVGQFEAILVSFFSDKRVDGIDRVVYEVNENMPLKAAQWFFKKQINFLSLPPEIAVEVDNTNDTEI